jgi:endonuclease/exonuclease/phosphatase family metal-dependent hydrolase
MLRGNGNYGNALLTNFPVMEDHLVDLTVPGREPRGAIDAVLRVNRRSVRVLVTHLGLRARERRTQAEKLLELLQDSRGKPPIVLADMNEWFPLGGSLRRFSQCLGKLPAPGTFPSRFPIFSLDRIWMGQGVRLEKMRVHRTPISRIASDHLPITARVRLEAPSGEAKQK